jgi:hypothetical protein
MHRGRSEPSHARSPVLFSSGFDLLKKSFYLLPNLLPVEILPNELAKRPRMNVL